MFINEKLPLKTNIPIFFAPALRCSVPPLRGGFPVSNIPLFSRHGGMRQKEHASINHFRFPRFGGIEISRRLFLRFAHLFTEKLIKGDFVVS